MKSSYVKDPLSQMIHLIKVYDSNPLLEDVVIVDDVAEKTHQPVANELFTFLLEKIPQRSKGLVNRIEKKVAPSQRVYPTLSFFFLFIRLYVFPFCAPG